MIGESKQRCVIVGASHAGARAAQQLRRSGWQGEITVVGEEPYLPYHRPPLSKDYLKGAKTIEDIRLVASASYEKNRISLRLGERAAQIDRHRREIYLESGDAIKYSQLILATGSRPRSLPVPGADLDRVFYLRSIADVDRIRDAAEPGRRAVVIGGGYIGLEAAASLKLLGMQVAVVEAMGRVMQRVTCESMSEFFTRLHREEGNDILVGAGVRRMVGGSGAVSAVELDSGERIDADLVVVGIGIVPNVELAADAGLPIRNGILVDEHARTADPHIFAVGDCACFTHPRYRREIRLESVQNANDQAAAAAKAICGDPVAYDALPWFWSDQFDVKLQIAGLADGFDRVVIRGEIGGARSFALFYLLDNRLIAVDAVNRPKEFVQGKQLILADSVVDSAKLEDNERDLVDVAA